MRIVCPGCTAAYEVPAEMVAARPMVRCVQCDEEWQAGPSRSPLRDDDADDLLAPVPSSAVPSSAVPSAAPAAVPSASDRLAAAAVAELVRPEDVEQAAKPALSDLAPPATGPRARAPTGPASGQTEPAATVPTATESTLSIVASPFDQVWVDQGPVDQDPSQSRVARQLTAADLVDPGPRHRRALAAIVQNFAAVAGWACSLGVLLALGWMVVEHRSRIMHAWPPSQRLFEWLGLA